MKRALIKTIMVPSLVAGIIIPLNIIASTTTTSFNNKLLSQTSDDELDSTLFNYKDNGEKKDRYVIIKNCVDVTPKPSHFTTLDKPTDINIELMCLNNRYHVSGVEKVVMCGKELIEGTDYEIIHEETKTTLHLLDSDATSKLYSLYVFPTLEENIFGCRLDGQSTREEGEPELNSDIAALEVFGGKICVSDSFTIRIRIEDEKWKEGWKFDEDSKIEINSGNQKITEDDVEYTIDSELQYVDIFVPTGVTAGDFVIIPKFQNKEIDPTKTFDLSIYAEGTFLEKRVSCISYDQRNPTFSLSIAPIDPDGARQFSVYPGSCKMNVDGEEKELDFTFNNKKITIDLSEYDRLGDISLDIDIGLRSGGQTPRDTFYRDSWTEIDTLEQFFSNDPNYPDGGNTDGFARAYALEHLSDFVSEEDPFRKEITLSKIKEWPAEDYTEVLPVDVVSVNQMPLAGEPDPEAKDDNIVKPSNKKAYFTFMMDSLAYYTGWFGNTPREWGRRNCAYYFIRIDFDNNSYFKKDKNINCWYRTDPPPASESGKNSHIRDDCANGFFQNTRFCSKYNPDLWSCIKHIANKTVTNSDDDSGGKKQQYVNDQMFIPTATQLGFKYYSFSKCGFMMEDDPARTERVFQIYKDKNFEYGDKHEELKRTSEAWDSNLRDNLWLPSNYWIATPASNNSKAGYDEDVAYIRYDGKIAKAEVDDGSQDYESIGYVLCFCI